MSLDNLRHAQYTGDGTQIDDPQSVKQSIVGSSSDQVAFQSVVSRGGIPRKSNNVAFSMDGSLESNGAISSGTWRCGFTLDFPFDAVSVGIMSKDTVTAGTGVKVQFAASDTAQLNGTEVPVLNGVRDDSQWVVGTWAGGAATGGIAIAASATDPAITWSDYAPVKAIPRVDGYPGYVFICGLYIPASWPNTGYGESLTAKQTQVPALFPGQRADWRYRAGDLVATPASWVLSTPSAASATVLFRFRVRKGCHSVGFFGDSTFQGYTTTGTLSYVERAARVISTAATPVVPRNGGWNGQTGAQYLARLKSALAAGEIYTCIVFESASPNDHGTAYTASEMTKAKLRVLEVIDIAQAKQIATVIVTPLPVGATVLGAPALASYLEFYAWAKSLESSGTSVYVADMGALHDSTNPGKWAAGLNTDTGYHPNDAGADVATTIMSATLTRAMLS